jgi:acetyl esterase/lipase
MPSFAAIAIALLMLALAMWTVVPAPRIFALGLTIGVPEFAVPLFAVFSVIAIALAFLARGGGRITALALCVISLLLLAWPPISAAITWRSVDAGLHANGFASLREHPLVAFDVTRDVPVPLRDGSTLALDLYRPQLPGTIPLIVTIYGGAWMFGSRAEDAPLARWYAARGYAVAVIDYRHAPVYRFPIQIHDVDDALIAIAQHASEWHVDRDRVALFGRSAGAQLALLAGESEQPVGVRAIVAYYAPTDLIGGWEKPPQPDPAHVRQILNTYFGGPPDAEHTAAYRAAAPLEHAHRGMPPVLAIIGDRDQLVLPEFQRNFAARLTALNVQNVAIELPWASHAFDAAGGLGRGIAQNATLRFLDALLSPR